MLQCATVKKSEDKEVLKAWERILVLAVVLIITALGYWIYAMQQEAKKPKPLQKSQMVSKSTECYNISVPKSYKTEVVGDKCQFVAYTGKSVKEPDNMLLIIPYQGEINSAEQAGAQLKQDAPQAAAYNTLKIGNEDAIFIEGSSAEDAKKETYNRFYVIYGLEPYKPSAGKGASTNAFRIGFVMMPKDKNHIEPIIESISWK